MSKEKRSEFPLDQSGWLVVNKIPAHFVGKSPASWPWDITVIEVPALLRAINLPHDCREKIRQLLMDLSNVILRDGSPADVDLRSIKLGGRGADGRSGWVERIAQLAPPDRLRCCVPNKANVRLVDERPLLLDPSNENELLFGEDPVAWIRNGLSAIDSKVLRSEYVESGSLFPCPAFIIDPCNVPNAGMPGKQLDTRDRPPLYARTGRLFEEL